MHLDFPSDLSLTLQSYFPLTPSSLYAFLRQICNIPLHYSLRRLSPSAFAHALLSEASSAKESRDARRETSWMLDHHISIYKIYLQEQDSYRYLPFVFSHFEYPGSITHKNMALHKILIFTFTLMISFWLTLSLRIDISGECFHVGIVLRISWL